MNYFYCLVCGETDSTIPACSFWPCFDVSHPKLCPFIFYHSPCPRLKQFLKTPSEGCDLQYNNMHVTLYKCNSTVGLPIMISLFHVWVSRWRVERIRSDLNIWFKLVTSWCIIMGQLTVLTFKEQFYSNSNIKRSKWRSSLLGSINQLCVVCFLLIVIFLWLVIVWLKAECFQPKVC